MNVWQARQACPHLILVIGDNRKYTWTSSRIVKIFLDFTPLVEVCSIDEAFLDVTGSLPLFGSAGRIAYLIKARIRHAFGITCSIGIAPNKLLAKLASDMRKPDGLTVIEPGKVTEVLARIPAKDLCGVGAKTARQLALFGIATCSDRDGSRSAS
jgi:DNA polymerase-4